MEEFLRFALKIAQFLVTFLLLYSIGFPYWMIVAAGLLIPIYGIYLMIRSPGKAKSGRPYADYKLLAIARSWHRVDIALCLTMAIVCLIFALLLFFFYFKFTTFTTKILLAACSSLLLSILYALNGILVTRKLQSGTIDIAANHKLFTTSTSKMSPLTTKSNDKAMDFFTNSRKRDESLSKLSEKNKKFSLNSEPAIRRKSAVPSPEPPKTLDDDDEDSIYPPKRPLSQQYSAERRPKVFSWFTDVGDTKKDVTTTIESSFMSPDSTKDDHLDAREQYIKSKQYRDFMDPNPNNKKVVPKRASSKITEKSMENFNEKFAAASNENLQHQQPFSSKLAPKLSSSIVSENYKPSTTQYSRKPIPIDSGARKESEDYKGSQQSILKKTSNNPFDTSQSSQESSWTSQNELDKAFTPKKSGYTERAIDVGSYKASPVEVYDSDHRKHSDTHSSSTLHSIDAEATPKAPRQVYGRNIESQFEASISTNQSHRSIEIDDSPGRNTPIRYKISQGLSEYHEIPAKVAVKSMVIPQKGVITGIARPYSFQEHQDELGSMPSRSISSLTGASSQTRDPGHHEGDTGTSSTIRMDDYDRGHTRSPLRDTSLMTTSTIVNMNSSSIRDWAHSPITASIERSHAFSDSEARIHAPVFSQKQSRDQGHKKGFDVIIRSRDSPIDMRPLSVTSSTEFPTKYNSSSTTLTIKTPPNYTQNRHLSTQF